MCNQNDSVPSDFFGTRQKTFDRIRTALETYLFKNNIWIIYGFTTNARALPRHDYVQSQVEPFASLTRSLPLLGSDIECLRT
jgi:hypothetical protein